MKLDLEKILIKYNLQQKELANIVGLKTNSMSNYVNGRRTLSFEQSMKIAEYLKIPIETLLDKGGIKSISLEDFLEIKKLRKQIDEIMSKYDF